jgi:glycosyltransferase involved in cell wall biosynthesis
MTYGVVTITRNAAQTLQTTIDSVLAQTVPPTQYVFVDGGSTDGTVAIIESAIDAMRSRAIEARLEQQHSIGITPAWNQGIRAIDADVVFILNADDWYEPDTASAVLALFDEHADVDIVLACGRYIDPASRRAVVCRPRPSWVLPVAMTVIHPACFVRRRLYERVGLFDENYAIVADYEFVYRCAKRKVPTWTSDRVVVNVLEGGTAKQHRRKARVEMAEIGRRYCPLPALPHLALQVRRLLDR